MPHVYDGPRCRDLHEQMWARFGTEIDDLDIAICQALNKRDPNFADVKFVCTAPVESGQAWWDPPNPFDLENASGFFQKRTYRNSPGATSVLCVALSSKVHRNSDE